MIRCAKAFQKRQSFIRGCCSLGVLTIAGICLFAASSAQAGNKYSYLTLYGTLQEGQDIGYTPTEAAILCMSGLKSMAGAAIESSRDVFDILTERSLIGTSIKDELAAQPESDNPVAPRPKTERSRYRSAQRNARKIRSMMINSNLLFLGKSDTQKVYVTGYIQHEDGRKTGVSSVCAFVEPRSFDPDKDGKLVGKPGQYVFGEVVSWRFDLK